MNKVRTEAIDNLLALLNDADEWNGDESGREIVLRALGVLVEHNQEG